MTAEIHAKLDQILRNQERGEAIVRSLALMIETQNTHTEMLAKLLEAAGSESPEGRDLAELPSALCSGVSLPRVARSLRKGPLQHTTYH